MKPEELSAEVLKSLCADVQRATGDTVKAAVITVPAEFDTPQTKATKAAAQLAGIKHTMLLTEPVAAAFQYGFDRQHDKTFWLAYDFGGGTFDAAVIQVRDGLIQVAGHGGDNHLGYRNIDWAIVEELFIPTVVQDRPLADFRRGITKWRSAIAKLKIQAEEARILLFSPTTISAEVHVDFLCNDDRGEPVEFDYVLQRSELERLASPFIRRTINVCKEVLAARRLTPADIHKAILVGEGTMHPLVRQLLSDSDTGLGVPLEFSVDPMTVVARGAAVFAASQRMVPDDPDSRIHRLTLEPQQPAIDGFTEIVGRVTGPPELSSQGLTLEFTNENTQPEWNSGPIPLDSRGSFAVMAKIYSGAATNEFRVAIRDAQGNRLKLTPDYLVLRTRKGSGKFH
jgi:molecular chaperone DnaK